MNTNIILGLGYADDMAGLIGGTDKDFMHRKLQKRLDMLVEWGKPRGLKFNSSKTVVVLFTRNSKLDKQPSQQLTMEGTTLTRSDSATYLGVTLDKKLFWREHINKRIATSKQLMLKLNACVRGIWGPKPKMTKYAYQGIIIPKLTYACLAWGHELTTKLMCNKLHSLNRLAMQSMTCLPRMTPTLAGEVILGLMPLDLIIQTKGLKDYLRLRPILSPPAQTINKHKLRHNISHTQYWHEMAVSSRTLHIATDKCKDIVWDKHYKVNTDSFDGKRKHVMRSEYTIYTDAAGAVIYHKNQIIASILTKLPDEATVFQAELIGIKTGYEFFFDNPNHTPKFVKIISDSQAALLALNNNTFTSSTALDTAEVVSNLAWIARKVTLA